jgi:hypothetical protein
MEYTHFYDLIAECDGDGSETLCEAEIYNCMIANENTWRRTHCPEANYEIFCVSPYGDDCPQCQNAWNCSDIDTLT